MIVPLLLALAQGPPLRNARAPQPASAVSLAGQAIANKYIFGRDPFIQQRLQRLRANSQAMAALTEAPRLDLLRLRLLMREQERLQAEIKRRADDRSLAMLGEMSEADRIRMVRVSRAAQRPMAKPPGAR